MSIKKTVSYGRKARKRDKADVKAFKKSAKANRKAAKGVKGKFKAINQNAQGRQRNYEKKVAKRQGRFLRKNEQGGPGKKGASRGYNNMINHPKASGAAIGGTIGAYYGGMLGGKKGAAIGAAAGAAEGAYVRNKSRKKGPISRIAKLNPGSKSRAAASGAKSPTYKRKLKNGKTVVVRKGKRGAAKAKAFGAKHPRTTRVAKAGVTGAYIKGGRGLKGKSVRAGVVIGSQAAYKRRKAGKGGRKRK